MRRLHSDHATHAAARRLIPPTLRLCCLDPSVTTPLYSTTVSQALRQTLRSQAVSELPRMPRMRTSPITICANFAVTEFSEVRQEWCSSGGLLASEKGPDCDSGGPNLWLVEAYLWG